ncbi:hypothetical protein HK100_004805 [Physocladia obscura]|uniref:Protein kinase domain-containing protein n=1 Tax=Physocladia obscura TaxID=109957 RepID=A0AAD5SUN2_9FUNG|nr:hypothetical protein HK100_004805 [Physocladia obscura]
MDTTLMGTAIPIPQNANATVNRNLKPAENETGSAIIGSATRAETRSSSLVLSRFIQAGAFASVFEAAAPDSAHPSYAVKCIPKAGLTATELCNQRIEVDLLTRISSPTNKMEFPNIVNLIAVHETDSHIFLVMDKYETDLLDAINSGTVCAKGPFYELEDALDMSFSVKQVFTQICDAVEACHKNGIYHQDIKVPENILLKFNDDASSTVLPTITAALSDFGLATTRPFPNTFGAGSVSYTCPESLAGLTADPNHNSSPLFYSAQVQDAWGLAVLLFILITGRTPWHSATVDDETYAEYQAWIRERKNNKPAKNSKGAALTESKKSNLCARYGFSDAVEEFFERAFDGTNSSRRMKVAEMREFIKGIDLFVVGERLIGVGGKTVGASNDSVVPKQFSMGVGNVLFEIDDTENKNEIRKINDNEEDGQERQKSWCSDFSDMDYTAVPVFGFDGLFDGDGIEMKIPAVTATADSYILSTVDTATQQQEFSKTKSRQESFNPFFVKLDSLIPSKNSTPLPPSRTSSLSAAKWNPKRRPALIPSQAPTTSINSDCDTMNTTTNTTTTTTTTTTVTNTSTNTTTATPTTTTSAAAFMSKRKGRHDITPQASPEKYAPIATVYATLAIPAGNVTLSSLTTSLAASTIQAPSTKSTWKSRRVEELKQQQQQDQKHGDYGNKNSGSNIHHSWRRTAPATTASTPVSVTPGLVGYTTPSDFSKFSNLTPLKTPTKNLWTTAAKSQHDLWQQSQSESTLWRKDETMVMATGGKMGVAPAKRKKWGWKKSAVADAATTVTTATSAVSGVGGHNNSTMNSVGTISQSVNALKSVAQNY